MKDFPAAMWCNPDSSCMTESSENLAGPQQLLDHENEAPAGFAISLVSASLKEHGEEKDVYTSMSDEDECETVCVICWEREACFVMDRCAHLVFCAKCRQLSCKAKHFKNHNVPHFHPNIMTMKKIQSIGVDGAICRQTSKTRHIKEYDGTLYRC